jgi:hypothetical protein
MGGHQDQQSEENMSGDQGGGGTGTGQGDKETLNWKVAVFLSMRLNGITMNNWSQGGAGGRQQAKRGGG